MLILTSRLFISSSSIHPSLHSYLIHLSRLVFFLSLSLFHRFNGLLSFFYAFFLRLSLFKLSFIFVLPFRLIPVLLLPFVFPPALFVLILLLLVALSLPFLFRFALLYLFILFILPFSSFGQPFTKYFFFHFMLYYLWFQVGPVILDPHIFLLGELYLFLCVSSVIVRFECHPVQVQSLSWGKINIILLWFKCFADCFFSIQLLRKNLNQQPNHFPDLMVDKRLANERKSNKAMVWFLWLIAFFKNSLYCGRLHLLYLHGNHVSVATWVRPLISTGKVKEIVSAEVEFD